MEFLSPASIFKVLLTIATMIFVCLTKMNNVNITLAAYNMSDGKFVGENVEPDALKEWKINIFKIIDSGKRFPTMRYVRPAKPQISLHLCTV